ncbi:MAG TPA: hypothetical protein PLO50_14075 [Nitrospira sp.]|nr:hypothetical protein [Nitrospira sp.]
MKQTYIWTAVAIFAAIGIVSHSPSIAEAGQGNAVTHFNGMMTNATNLSESWQESRRPSSLLDRSLIHRVGADSYSGGYSGMSGPDTRSGSTGSYSQQGSISGDKSSPAGDYKFSSPGNDSRYGSTPSNPSDNYFKKESSGSSTGPYGGSIYGGLPSTPSADPMIKDLSR